MCFKLSYTPDKQFSVNIMQSLGSQKDGENELTKDSLNKIKVNQLFKKKMISNLT